MDLQEAKHEVERKLEEWHDDLRQINSALDHAIDGLGDVNDVMTAEKFSGYFGEFKKLVKGLEEEVGKVAEKEVNNLKKEAVNSAAKKE